MKTETCIACGVETEISDGPVHKYLGSSPGCWAKFGEILAREYENFEYMSVHGLTVDAYALQHPGTENAQTINSANVHLASLYSYFELGTPISELSKVKQKITKYKDQFVWLDPPDDMSEISVTTILESNSPSEHRESVVKWATYIYEKWKDHHPKIATLLAI